MEENAYCIEHPISATTAVRRVIESTNAREIVWLDGRPGDCEYQFIATWEDADWIKRHIPSSCTMWAI